MAALVLRVIWWNAYYTMKHMSCSLDWYFKECGDNIENVNGKLYRIYKLWTAMIIFQLKRRNGLNFDYVI